MAYAARSISNGSSDKINHTISLGIQPWFVEKNNKKKKIQSNVKVSSISDVQIGNISNKQDLVVFGDINHTGSIYSLSDKNYKHNITPLIAEDSNLFDLKPISYNYLDDPKIHFGFIAQDVEEVYPNLVSEETISPNSQKAKVLNMNELIPLLLNKMRKMDEQINVLKERNIYLENELKQTTNILMKEIKTVTSKYHIS